MGNQQLDELVALKDRLQARAVKVKQKLAEIEKQVEAVSITLNLLKRGEDGEEPTVNISARELQGMKQLEALVYVAKQNNGRVRIMDAKQLLGKAGIMKLGKNSYGVLYTVITRSGKFKRSGPGEYELLAEPSVRNAA